ncbi:Ser/Thr protein phosphatase superfamily protein [Fonsecaea pedrosoi]|nr:Ser/Thr protein phosphatase superfamily protein [Fonsecaea pedrosoi]
MIVSQVIAAVQAALAREKIVFCVVEEVALNYYNVPRILNLDAATKLINAHNDVFVRTAWTDQHADWKKPYPRFEAFIEEDYLTLVIFPDTHFHLQPLKHSIVDRSAYSSARPFFSNEFNFSTDISELSTIPIPRLSSLLQGLLRRFCETQDIYCAVCVEQLVDGMVLSEAWCNTHLDPGREEELKYVIGVIGTRPQRQNLFLESDYLCQDERELMKIPGTQEPLHDRETGSQNGRSWKSAFQRACLVALALFRSTISRLAAHKHSVSLQYMSDLHLESQQTYDFEIPRVSPYLVLAGDIGRLKDYGKYLEFLTIQCQRFWRVFLVLGNHEFYGILRQEGLETARSLEQEPCLGGKLTVLNRTMFRLNRRIAILGCTLHTSIPSESELWVRMKVADFSHIGDWTVESHNAEHYRDTEWLRTCVQDVTQANAESKILVVTHHAPALKNTCDPKYLSNPWNSAFCSDILKSQIPHWSGAKSIRCWIFGHTHWSAQFVYRGTAVCSNQRGVPRVQQVPQQLKTQNEIWLKRILPRGCRQSQKEFLVTRSVNL